MRAMIQILRFWVRLQTPPSRFLYEFIAIANRPRMAAECTSP